MFTADSKYPKFNWDSVCSKSEGYKVEIYLDFLESFVEQKHVNSKYWQW